MYPLKFKPIYMERIWGGRDMEMFRQDLPAGNIGESWDVACHKNGTSVVVNGEYKGLRIDELIKIKGEELLGKKVDPEWFPLLVKLINAKDKLSVQVHPNDNYAKIHEGEMGKTEIWYVVEALDGANLVVGTKECTKEQFKEALENGILEKYMNKVSVEKGDVFFVQSGLLHAIGEGVIVAEIQQNSDVTYRVYDYNRGRELHVEKALEVLDLTLGTEKISKKFEPYEGFSKVMLCQCKDFVLEEYIIDSCCNLNSCEDRFEIITCVDGKGTISYEDGEEEIRKGDSIMIPATLGSYKIRGSLRLLLSYYPQ